MNYIKHKSICFSRQTNLYHEHITLSKLKLASRKNGYIVKSYSTSLAMLIMLGVYDEAKSASSVSTKDTNGNVIIFIDDTLTESKQTFALAHEIGHIVLEHSPQIPKAVQENEANKFAHYLLNMKSSKPHWNLINIIPLIALLCACLFIYMTLFTQHHWIITL